MFWGRWKKLVVGAAGSLETVSIDRRAVTFEELSESHRSASAPTSDDVTVLFDGRRLDSKEKVLEWLAQIESDRAAGRSALAELP
jgi:hypothetical protein